MDQTQPQAPNHCGICLEQAPLTYQETHDGYTLWECAVCVGQFWDPMQNPGAQWYEHDERYADRNADPHMKPVITHRMFLRDNPAPNGTLLDLGMGTGNFINAARKIGYDVHGLDFDTYAIEVAKNVFGLRQAYAMTLAQFREHFPQKQFAVVTLFEVLEHLDNPQAFVREIHDVLEPGGFMVISTPYRGSWQPFKVNDVPPRHLSRWNRTAYRHFLSANGFDVVKFRRYGASFAYLVTKFHFWTAGYLSFGLVAKAKKLAYKRDAQAQGETSTQVPQDNPSTSPKRSGKIQVLFVLAKIKDYTLFSIPAAVLWVYLRVTRNHMTGIYVLAKKQ